MLRIFFYEELINFLLFFTVVVKNELKCYVILIKQSNQKLSRICYFTRVTALDVFKISSLIVRTQNIVYRFLCLINGLLFVLACLRWWFASVSGLDGTSA